MLGALLSVLPRFGDRLQGCWLGQPSVVSRRRLPEVHPEREPVLQPGEESGGCDVLQFPLLERQFQHQHYEEHDDNDDD